MIRTPAQVLTILPGLSRNAPAFQVGECLKECHEVYGIPTDGTPSAAAAWAAAKYKHPVPADLDRIPLGAFLFWIGTKFGHIAIYAGHGMCWSTDILRPGHWDLVPVGLIAQKWGAQHRFAGWSEDVDGERVPGLAPPPPIPPKEPVVISTPHIDRAIAELGIAIDARKPGPVRYLLRTSRRAAAAARKLAKGA